MTSTQLERIESVKMGFISGLSMTITFCLVTLIVRSMLLPSSGTLMFPLTGQDGFSSAVVFISGVLFGITYRYVIQAAPNPQLKPGTVMAFGLVRGLAQVDAGWATQPPLWLPIGQVMESILLFGVAALLLEWAINRAWIKP